MLDQLQIGNMYSYDDFEASVAERKIGTPKKKTIKETVPFSNLTYDFSAIGGEIYYEERDLEYVFEITADTPEELEELKIAFASWIMNVMQEKLYDPFIEDYHFLATYDDMSCDDDEGMDKSTITVKFKAYPYKIANNTKKIVIPLYAYEEAATKIVNNSSHRITPTFNTDIGVSLEIGGTIYSIPSGEVKDESFKIESGVTEITVKNNEVISEKKSGNNIVFENSASAKFKNIVVYGKSWQNGTPTPTEPQPIESLENVEVKVLGTEEQTLTIPYVLRGIGDVKDYVDFERKKLVRRIHELTLTDFSSAFLEPVKEGYTEGKISLGSLGISFIQSVGLCDSFRVKNWGAEIRMAFGADNLCFFTIEGEYTKEEWIAKMNEISPTIIFALKTPIETDLTDDEIAAYKALKANEPTTTIMSDAELEVEFAVKPDTPVQVGTLKISFVEEVF